MKIKDEDECSEFLKDLKHATLLGQGVEGCVYAYKGKAVKKINLGKYPNSVFHEFDPLTYRINFEIDCLKKLSALNESVTPRFKGAWKCFDKNIHPLSDQLTESSRIRPIDSEKGYYTIYILMEMVKNAMTMEDYIDEYPDQFNEKLLHKILDKILILYKNDIISTDIHSNNILFTVSKNGTVSDVFIIDFGLAWRGNKHYGTDKISDFYSFWYFLEQQIKVGVNLLDADTEEEQIQKLDDIFIKFIKDKHLSKLKKLKSHRDADSIVTKMGNIKYIEYSLYGTKFGANARYLTRFNHAYKNKAKKK